MVDQLNGINVHVSGDLKVNMAAKKCAHTWLLTLTSKASSMKRVCLLDDSSRKHFHIAAVTLGPKKLQRVQKLENHCQEWLNPDFDVELSSDYVYRIKVRK